VAFAGDIRTVGNVRFSGGVSGPGICAKQTNLFGHYSISCSGVWTPKALHVVNANSSLTVDQYRPDSIGGVSVKRGGEFACRLAQVPQGWMFVDRNDGVVTVSETATFQGGGTRFTPASSSRGEFRINRLVVSGGEMELNAREANWQDVYSITSNVNYVMGPGGVELSDASSCMYTWWNRGVAFGCTDDWTFGAKPNGDGAIYPYDNMSLYFDTSDHDDRSVKHTVTIAGKIWGPKAKVAAYGGGTIRFACTDADQFRGGFAVLDATTLEYASTSARVGNGDVCLAPGSTLALPAAGSGPVTIAGRLALTKGVGTVHVRLGSAGSAVKPGVYPIATVEGGVDSNLLSRLSLVNAKKEKGGCVFSLSTDSKTIELRVGAAAK